MKNWVLAASALAGSMMFAGQAYAQTVATDTQAAVEEGDDQTVVVTGSRIRSVNADSPNPITVIAPDQIFSSGRVSVGDVLNDLPQLGNNLGSQNSTSGLGVRGLNFLNLRNLGRARTLVLVNGRRHVTADIINNGNAVDINTMPTDLIENIEIVTGGTSAIYGSDAIAGVVNIKIKDDFSGVQLHGQTGISTYGDAGNQYLSVVAGQNFADGRGNIAINAEFAHQQDYYATGRANLERNDAFVVVDTDVGSPFDDVPDRIFFQDIRSATISPGGQVGIRYPGTGTTPCGIDAVGSSFTCGFLFQRDGTLTPQTGLRVGIGPNGNYIGGNGQTGREGQLLVLSPDLKRYVVNALGHFEISPAIVPFFEAKYVKTTAFGSQSGPFFSQGQTLSDGASGISGLAGTYDRSYVNGTYVNNVLQPTGVNREGIRLDNPYLSASARATLVSQLTAAINAGVNPNTGIAYGTTTNGLANRAAALAQVAAGTFRFSTRRNWLDLGIRDERIERETFRIVGGVRGDLSDHFGYELSAVYGKHIEHNLIRGNVNRQRFLLANDATRNAQGQIVCRSQVDSRYAGTDRAGNAAQLAADVAACVPLNPFGEGSVSDAARSYLLMNTTAFGRATQFVGTGYVRGDLGDLFELPGGPIGFAVGGEYRRETLYYDLDDLTQAGYAFYNAIPTFSAPAFEVKEAFGEVSIPLVKDVVLLKELTINGAARVADYKGATGTVYAYSTGATWRPVQDIMFRGSYSRSIRAPYLGEVYSQPGQNFTPAPNDPCSTRNINTGSATRTANCTAAGRPAGYDYVYTSSLEIISGGNLNLKEEKGTTYTFGGAFQPTFLPGLNLTADYYNIKVDDVITSPTVQQVLNGCYDAPTLDNVFCSSFQRAGASGGPRGEIPFQILAGSFQDSPLNYAQYKAQGIDTNLEYSHKFDWGALRMKGIWTHIIQLDYYTDPSRPKYKNVQTGELGIPTDAFNITTDVKIGRFSVGHTLRWLDHMYLNTFEDYNGVNGEPPQNPDYATLKQYPTVTYHDVRFGLEVNDKFEFAAGINNVSNRKPPYGLTGVGAGSGIYDNRGRFFYAGATAKF